MDEDVDMALAGMGNGIPAEGDIQKNLDAGQEESTMIGEVGAEDTTLTTVVAEKKSSGRRRGDKEFRFNGNFENER